MQARSDVPRRRRVLAAVALSAATALSAVGAAHAADRSRLAEAFGNTVLSIYPDGRYQQLWLHPDGQWDGVGRSGVALAGRWFTKGEKVCLRQSKPPTLPIAFCTPFPKDAKVGVAWTSKDVVGTPIQLKVVKGMAAARAGK